MPGDIGVDIAVFESEVASFGGAVYESKSFTVAKGLSSLDMTVYKGEIFRVPAEIFAFYDRIFHGDVFAVPESVFCIEEHPRISAFSTYWKEYLPSMRTSFMLISLLSKRKYSDTANVFSIFSPRHRHPNSGDTAEQRMISTDSHSLRVFIPPR